VPSHPDRAVWVAASIPSSPISRCWKSTTRVSKSVTFKSEPRPSVYQSSGSLAFSQAHHVHARSPPQTDYGLFRDAKEFPLIVVIATIFSTKHREPLRPYPEGDLDACFCDEHGSRLDPQALRTKIAQECDGYRVWMRATGGGEPMVHRRRHHEGCGG
jgi:hypothetical protein